MTSPMTASSPRSESCRKSAPPTMQMPVKMTAMPTQRNHSSCFLRKILEKIPTKIMMEPRSIWNCEALVMVRLTYIMVVATTSHSAGGKKGRGGFLGLVLGIFLGLVLGFVLGPLAALSVDDVGKHAEHLAQHHDVCLENYLIFFK